MKTLRWSSPKITVVHNVDVMSHADIKTIQQALVQQLSQSVRWVETVQKLEHMGCAQMIECGPGKVLTGLNKRIVTTALVYNVGELALMKQVVNS